MGKLTFDEAIERLNDDRSVSRAEVRADALDRVVWIAEWHLPGCLSESRSIVMTKADAIDAALSMAEGEDGPPHGMRADLLRWGRSDRQPASAYVRGAITVVERCTLSELI